MIYPGFGLIYLYIRNFTALHMIADLSETEEEGFASKKTAWILAALMTFICIVLERLRISSGWILLITVLFSACLAGFISSGDLFLRTLSSVLSFFLFTGISFLIGTILVLFFLPPSDKTYQLAALNEPGSVWLIYRFSCIIAFFLLVRVLRRFRTDLKLLSRGRLCLLLVLSGAAFSSLFALTQILSSGSVLLLQRAVLLTVTLVFLLVTMSLLLIDWITRHHASVHEKGLWHYTNELLESNYRQLFSNQQTISRQVHDFTNHLQTLKGLMDDGSSSAKQYITDLLETSVREAASCHSGNEVIDAIINCKKADAEDLLIPFTYVIQLPPFLSIDSIDLCAVLANLLDNALEACQRISNPKERFIHVSIGPKYNFLFFKVENSVEENPLGHHRPPITTKKDRSRPHGLGLKNVLETVRRYNGALEHTCKGHRFSTVAMMQLPSEDIRKMEMTGSQPL